MRNSTFWARRARFGLLLLPVVLQMGCYTYRPINTASIGDRVRARLTTAEAIRQSEVTGDPVVELEGTVAGITDEQVRLQVTTARGETMGEAFSFKRDYQLPRGEIIEFGIREIQPLRTAGLVAVVGGLVYLILDSTVIGGGGGDDPGPGDPANTILNFRIGR